MTPSQKATLKAFLLSGTDSGITASVASRSDGETARLLNLPSTFYVYKTTTPVDEIFESILWANLTPADAPDDTQLWHNRSMACQGKQNSLMLMLQGRSELNTGRANTRTGLSDALTNIPSGASGAMLSGGWLGATGVKSAITKLATIVEAMFATGTGTAGQPGDLVFNGPIQMSQVSEMLNEV